MADEVRFGIVGLGMGRDRAKKATDTPGARLVAVCDILEERGAKAAEELEVEWIKDYEEMLARDDIDAVGVFTPSGWHCDFALQALQAGKHACTTKPMDLTVAWCWESTSTAATGPRTTRFALRSSKEQSDA